MKLILTLILTVLTLKSISAQKRVYLDENGNEVKEKIFRKKWLNKNLLLSRWDYIGNDGKR
ncbi:MAG TPA: hypothetical protein VKN14_00265, partial [Flavobacteriaceae bacterium]|nr:hypothetical protein [Flavobacteriaceae bacterium]